TPNEKDVEDFKRAFQSRFPGKFAAVRSEDTIEEDIGNLKQEATETLRDYYGRAQHLLRRSQTKDAPLVGGTPLSTAERILLQMTIKAFIRGIYERDLKKAILTRPRPTSLQEAFEVAQQALAGIKEIEEEERIEYDKIEVEMLRKQYLEKHGRPLRSVLAEMQKSNMEESLEKRVEKMHMPRKPFQEPVARPVPVKDGLSANNYFPSQQYRHPQGRGGNPGQGNVQNEARPMPPRNLSRHPVINGSRPFDKRVEVLCIRCGDLGHKRPECTGKPLEWWEQTHLRNLVMPDPTSNYVGYRDGGAGLR
ncbi:hypothetical protein K3495_g16222, partial [Podosphaera aphanis]